jgi:xylan 1,4-beta-xylosidase
LGPYTSLGPIVNSSGAKPGFGDPMLFSDEGRLFLYWGCSAVGGIWGVELNADDPTKMVGTPKELITYQPDLFPWERAGEHNQKKEGWMEGSWMLKQNGKYYLTYSAAGTENRSYAMGCYISDSPLGTFKPQKLNPILRNITGLITGTGHGCVVAGPEGKLWAFFCVQAGISEQFERRIGLDRGEINSDGELEINGPTEFPQWLPGANLGQNGSNDTGWRPLGTASQTVGSTSEAGHTGDLAADDEIRTYWQPTAADTQPTLTQAFAAPARIHSVRIIWHDIGIDTRKGINPGPFQYRVECETSAGSWQTILDRTSSTEDLVIDYRECEAVSADKVRLTITGWPKGITPGVCEFTAFGETSTGAAAFKGSGVSTPQLQPRNRESVVTRFPVNTISGHV